MAGHPGTICLGIQGITQSENHYRYQNHIRWSRVMCRLHLPPFPSVPGGDGWVQALDWLFKPPATDCEPCNSILACDKACEDS